MNERPSLSGAAPVSFTLNGIARTVVTAPGERLSEVVRRGLGLTGTKVGCNAGDCGACTVLMDGAQVCACMVAARQAEGRSMVSIEGLAELPLGRALQAAFHRHDAAQCGICTPGMLMAAADVLSRHASPDRQTVMDAMGGVLCRCTGYLKIVDAVLDVAQAGLQTKGSGARPGEAVGQRVLRLDGAPKLTGEALYGDDGAPADALWLKAIRSPHAHARFSLGDLAPFLTRHPGIVRVFTAGDVPGENAFGIYPDLKDQPVFGEGIVRHRGEAVLALAGTRAALEAVQIADLPITWEPLPGLHGVQAALAEGAPAIHAGKPDNVLTRGVVACGQPEAARANAAHIAEGTFETSFVEHAYIEPEAGYARRVGDRMEIHACTQAPMMDRDEVARVLGLAREHVRIVPTACGGGFGGKLDVSLQPMLAVAAWHLDRPVRCVYERIESMASTTKRHPARIRARASCDAAGRLVSYELDGDFNTGAYASWGPTVAGRVPVHAAGPYRVPHVRNRARAVYTNDTPAGAFRGFGVPQAAIAHEALLDDLAEQAGIDRLELRHRNALRAGDTTPTGQVLGASAGLVACLDALRPRWQALLSDAAAFNAWSHALRRGLGIGCMWYGIGNTGLSNPSTMRLTLARDGTLTFWNGAVDIGQGSTTVLTQIAADALGLPVSAFRLVVGDTDVTFDAGKTSASRQTFVSGKAAQLAGEALRTRILRLTNAGPGARLDLDGARLIVADGGEQTVVDLAQLPAAGDGIVLEGVGTFDPPTTPLDAKGQGIPYATYGFAAQIASVDVDLGLGTVKVRRIVAAHDVGRAINPALVEGQIHGGIAQGLGLALMEEFIPGRTENLHDYLIPTFGDMPEIEVHLIEDREPLGPYGAKGIGEPALIPTAPAILGAIRHATGVTIRKVPALPHRVHAALAAAGKAVEF
ncbi:MAG: molybdopterin-dependent oxidoreductase [Hyphomonadaceae bacterium]|nr:molybdopterin-dependent oxidoreductase [Hyphomonadaceae bacterium]